jgi:hypothetical protein
MTTDNLVPPAEETLPVLYTLSVSVFGALAQSQRPDPHLDGKLIVCERNGDITIEHADPHIVIADGFLNQIANGDGSSCLGVRPPQESAPAGVHTGPAHSGRTLGLDGLGTYTPLTAT